MSRIIVIGSRFGGLSVAARLAARGHQVELFEKRDKLGGRAYVYDIDGYRIDGGPTVITAAWIFDEIWQAAGRSRRDYFQLVVCDPLYRIFDHNRQPFDFSGDHDVMLCARSRSAAPPMSRDVRTSLPARRRSSTRAWR